MQDLDVTTWTAEVKYALYLLPNKKINFVKSQ